MRANYGEIWPNLYNFAAPILTAAALVLPHQGMRLLAALILVCLALPAQADRYVSCVHDQLLSAGFDPGADNDTDYETIRGAIRAFETEHGHISTRQFTPDTAPIWCRLIGLVDPDLTLHWPGSQQPHDLHFSDTIAPTFRADVRAFATRARQLLESETGARLAGRHLILVADDAEDLLAMLQQHTDVKLSNPLPTMRNTCASEAGIGGLAVTGVMLVCIGPGNTVGQGIVRRQFETVIMHEYMHLLQTELAGTTYVRHGEAAIVASSGPLWLKEGTADMFAFRQIYGVEPQTYQNAMLDMFDAPATDLDNLERLGALQSRQVELYLVGGAATAEAIGSSDMAVIAEFYERLGRGEAWQPAFELAFGMSPEVLYACEKWANTNLRGPCPRQ